MVILKNKSYGNDLSSLWKDIGKPVAGACGLCMLPLGWGDNEVGSQQYEPDRLMLNSYSPTPSHFPFLCLVA